MSPKRRRPTGVAAATLTGIALAMGVQPAAPALESRSAPPVADNNPGAFAKIMDATFQRQLGDSFIKGEDDAFFGAVGETFQKVFPDPAQAASALAVFRDLAGATFEKQVGATFLKIEGDTFDKLGPLSYLQTKGFDKTTSKLFKKEAGGDTFLKEAQAVFDQIAPSVVGQFGATFDKHHSALFSKALGKSLDTFAGETFFKYDDEAFVAIVGDSFVKLVPPSFAAGVGDTFLKIEGETFLKIEEKTFKKVLGSALGAQASQLMNDALGNSFIKMNDEASAAGAGAVSEAIQSVAPQIGMLSASKAAKAFSTAAGDSFDKQLPGFDAEAQQAFLDALPAVLDRLGQSALLPAVQTQFVKNAAGFSFYKPQRDAFTSLAGATFLKIENESLDDLVVDAGEIGTPGTPN